LAIIFKNIQLFSSAEDESKICRESGIMSFVVLWTVRASKIGSKEDQNTAAEGPNRRRPQDRGDTDA
jgi:hypothetical protein